MPAPRCSDTDFIQLFTTIGPETTAKQLKMDVRSVYYRRARIEQRIGRAIEQPNRERAAVGRPMGLVAVHSHRHQISIKNGVILVGGDAHYWPGEPTAAHRAFVAFCKEYRPKAVIVNGDVLDASTISRHPPIGWEKRPTLIEEIEVCQERLHEIEKATPRACELVWNLGNHDGRFETRIATVAPEFAKIHGVHLRDHFPLWTPAWATWINDVAVVKHRFKSGIHAPHNNTLWAGRTIITGHLHSQKVMPISDYNGTRWGVDTGCLADPDARAFVDYSEDNPKSWRSGFVVLTFVAGELLPPELVTVWRPDAVTFRGSIIKV